MKFILNSIILLILCFSVNNPANAIKIGLYTQYKKDIFFGVSKNGVIVNTQTGDYILLLEPMKSYKIKKKKNFIEITINKKKYRISANKIIIKNTRGNGFVYTKKKWYKGHLQIINTKKGLTVINEIELESYIKGVVPAEMPSKWNIEAHKAQAIAARSYALANMNKRGAYGYDLKDTPEDQAYLGASGETLQTNRAVEATKGQVLVYDNKIISAYYHASSGGSTLSSKDVWGRALPYLIPVRSFDENLPKNGHRVGMSQNGANTLANKGYSAYQILGYFYKNVMLKQLY